MRKPVDKPYRTIYEKLIREFPLRPIRTQEDNDQAAKNCDSLTDKLEELSDAERNYLEVLSELIGIFEERCYKEEDVLGACRKRVNTK